MVSSPAATGDGRLLFIEDDRRIRLVARGALMAEPVLEERDVATRLIHVVVDPSFDRTVFVFVALATTRAGGARNLSVVRYRMVANRFGEGARIISDMPIPRSGDVKFVVDGLRAAVSGHSRGRPEFATTKSLCGLHSAFQCGRIRAARKPLWLTDFRAWLRAADRARVGRPGSSAVVIGRRRARWPFPVASVNVGGVETGHDQTSGLRTEDSCLLRRRS